MRRIVLCLALSFVAPAMAQSTKTRLEGLEQRLGQLEEVMKGQALVEMSQRVDQLERELRELRGEADALAQANAALKKQQLDIAADLEQRLAAIEARERAAAEAAAKVAAPSSGESPATPAEGTPGEPASVVAESDGKSPELRYGEAFMRQYGDASPDLVKSDWADVLDGFDRCPEAIAYALRYLPAEKPPNALQFRELCRRAPVSEAPALAAPRQPMPESVRAKLAALTGRLRATGEPA